jgi:GAF domain-containing protein
MPTTKLKSVQPELPESGDQRTLHLETLYRLTDRLYRASGTEPMLSAAMEAIIEGLGCEKCSILLFDAEGVMRFVAWRGLSETCRRKLEGHTPWQPDSLDPPPIFIPDIAERKRAEVQCELLLAELNHRVKNTLRSRSSRAWRI